MPDPEEFEDEDLPPLPEGAEDVVEGDLPPLPAGAEVVEDLAEEEPDIEDQRSVYVREAIRRKSFPSAMTGTQIDADSARAMGLGEAMSFGLLDEVGAAQAALLGGRNFEEARRQARGDMEMAREVFPEEYGTGTLGGGAVSLGALGPILGTVSTPARAAIASGGLGALSGAASGETAEERALDALIGGAVSGATGALGAGVSTAGRGLPTLLKRAAMNPAALGAGAAALEYRRSGDALEAAQSGMYGALMGRVAGSPRFAGVVQKFPQQVGSAVSNVGKFISALPAVQGAVRSAAGIGDTVRDWLKTNRGTPGSAEVSSAYEKGSGPGALEHRRQMEENQEYREGYMNSQRNK